MGRSGSGGFQRDYKNKRRVGERDRNKEVTEKQPK